MCRRLSLFATDENVDLWGMDVDAHLVAEAMLEFLRQREPIFGADLYVEWLSIANAGAIYQTIFLC